MRAHIYDGCFVGTVLSLVLAFAGSLHAQQAPRIIVEGFWGSSVVIALGSANTEAGIRPVLEADYVNLRRFIEGEAQIVALRMYPTNDAKTWIYGFRGSEISPTAYVVGQAKVLVVVNLGNAVNSLNCEQFRMILGQGGEKVNWSAVGGTTGVVKVFGESKKDPISRAVIHDTAMKRVVNGQSRGFYPFGANWQECSDGEEVLKKVRANPNAIGFLQYKGTMPVGVKVLPVAKGASDAVVKLSEGPRVQPDYLLAESLVLYLHPSQPEGAKRFCEFAVGSAGSAIAEKFGLITPYMQRQVEGKARLAETKSGKCVRLSAIGADGCRMAVPDLATEYVWDKEAVQLSYSLVENELTAMGGFINGDGTREVLFLSGTPNDAVLKVHGGKWKTLNPTEYLVAGRAVAVIVNAANKLDSLTIDQLQDIYGGKVYDWKTLGATAASSIACFRLSPTDPVSGIFHKECLTPGSFLRVKMCKDTAEAVSAVSMDPGAIAFVDLTAIPTKGQTVKVLRIGPVDKAVAPTPESIRDASYPFSQRYYLYVHPKASETAKSFARFIGTCGASEATPYADTVKAVKEAFLKNGLIGLGTPEVKPVPTEATPVEAK